MRIVFPDPLTWQSGIEFGLQALGELQRRGLSFEFSLRDEGPMLEAAAFAVNQYGMLSKVRWVRRWPRSWTGFDVALFPRVITGEAQPVLNACKQGVLVITSDPGIKQSLPNLYVFGRRDCRELASCIEKVARGGRTI
jgi:hypothetical protein